MDDRRIERVLRAVECLAVGQVATYGDIAEITDESPRLVGRILAQWGSNVQWWRVCNARGEIPGHTVRALEYWRQEGLELGTGQNTVRLSRHRVDREDLREQWVAAVADLDETNL